MNSIIGTEEFKSLDIWKAVCAEFLGTGFLVLVGCGSTTGEPSLTEIALSFGLTVGVIVQAICHVSGGHINPAVTVGILIAGNFSIIRAILYVIAQLIGAIIGAAILKGLNPASEPSLGLTILGAGVSSGQGLGIEIMITFVLVFVVCAVVDPNRTDVKGQGPLFIGLSITACHLWAVKYTGSSMNTARSFGPALILNSWDSHWIYWVGPLLGGFIAGVLYKYLFAASKEEIPVREEETQP